MIPTSSGRFWGGRRRARLRHRPWRRWPGVCARDRWLRFLDLSPQRHHSVLLLLRHFRSLANGDSRRPVRGGSVRALARRSGNGVPASVKLCLRDGGRSYSGAQSPLDARRPLRHGHPRPRLPSPGGARICNNDSGRKWPGSQRFSLVLLRSRRLARAACDGLQTGPMVMFGTNRPSITSMWIQSAPAESAARTSSPRREKSADKIEGAMRIGDARGERTLKSPTSGIDLCPDMLLDVFRSPQLSQGRRYI